MIIRKDKKIYAENIKIKFIIISILYIVYYTIIKKWMIIRNGQL